jgi:hypothetical protein
MDVFVVAASAYLSDYWHGSKDPVRRPLASPPVRPLVVRLAAGFVLLALFLSGLALAGAG